MGNNAWFEQNCDPDDNPNEQQEEVASGGGGVNRDPAGNPSPNTINTVLENLIGQCYGEQSIATPNFGAEDGEDALNEFDLNWEGILDVLDGYGADIPSIGKLKVVFDDEEDPNGMRVCFNKYGEEIECVDQKDVDIENCVKNFLDCQLKPFAGGAWKPPQADCDNFYATGMFGMSNKICVRNCVPERMAIYQHSVGTVTATATFSDKDTITVTGTGTCLVTLEHYWKDQQYVAGTAVDTISVGSFSSTKSGTRGKNTQTIELGVGTHNISYTGLHPTGGYNIEVNDQYGSNKTIVFRDGHDTDVNARFSILSSGTPTNHTYQVESSTPSGYTTGGVHFYGLPNGEARGAVPVYRAYSSVNTDTMLTTDPAGEAGTMGAMGFGQTDILFYGFLDASDMISTLAEGEQAAPLYRYYSQSSQDHMYTLTPIGGTPILANLDLGYYDLLDTAETYLNIDFDFRRGGAGYDNTLGWYVTDTNDNPIHGRVIVENATDASGKLTYKIPADELNQYIPCRLGFFLIPDGDNRGTSKGDAVTFSTLNDGWRIDQSTSAQSNYTFFSERRLNSGDKAMTRWPDRAWQYWEDLLNGDNDYDDMKMSYKLQYGDSEYLYEGIQCFVYKQNATPEYETITTVKDCENQVFDTMIRNMSMTRTECGRIDEDFGCSECLGSISSKSNNVQTLVALKSATLTLRSHGGMTGGWGDCTEFTWSLHKNGNQLVQKRTPIQSWGRIGEVIYSFDVVRGDRITFNLETINSGHFNGRVTPNMAIRDESSKEYQGIWEIALSTQSGTYRNQHPSQNTGNLGSHEPTEFCGLPYSFQLFNYTTANAKVNFTQVLSNKVVQSNVLQIRGDDVAMLNVIGKNGDLISRRQTGDSGYHIVTGDNGLTLKLKWTVHDAQLGETDWELEQVMDYGKGGFFVNDEFNIFIGQQETTKKLYYPPVVLGVKITGINDIECPASSSTQGVIQDISLEATYSRAESSPRQLNVVMVNNRVLQSNEFIVNMSDIFTSFFRYDSGVAQSFHEYYLQQSVAGNDVVFYTDYYPVSDIGRGLGFRLKIRVSRQDYYVNTDQYKFDNYGWFGNVSISQVFSYGKGYEASQQIQIQWPPRQLQYTNGNEATSPYFPSQVNLPRKVLVRDATSGRFKRNARYAIYQDMHDKSSQLWYSNQNSFAPHQMRWFDIIITETD